MQVLLYWEPHHAAVLAKTLVRLTGAFELALDVLVTAVDSAALDRAGLSAPRVKRLPATGALETDIVRACSQRPYDLVITPPAERPGLLRMVLGSRIGQLVRQAPATIWIARPGADAIRRIVVGVSGGPQTAHDIRLTALLARAFDAHVTLVHVVSQLPLIFGGIGVQPAWLANERLAKVEPGLARLREAGELLTAASIPHELIVREGLVDEELLAVANGVAGGRRADLLVLGVHAPSVHTPVDYYVDIAEQVAQAAPVSTLVVHAESDWSRWSAVYTGPSLEAGQAGF
jgi:nucleotide-binding universal stress UspA family protein